jgi:hypothetical protein
VRFSQAILRDAAISDLRLLTVQADAVEADRQDEHEVEEGVGLMGGRGLGRSPNPIV